MINTPENRFSQTVNDFHGRELVERDASLVGYSAIIQAFNLNVTLPARLALISRQHRRYDTEQWAVFTPRHQPEDSLTAHLVFALRYEGVELEILDALFAQISGEEIAEWVRREPVGRNSRRIWFFYEWLTEKTLDVPDATTGTFVDALDPKQYFVAQAIPSKRHRVRNNLTGVRDFCPLVRRTEKLNSYVGNDWRARAQNETGKIHPDILSRAAAFLLLKDSQASFAIEGETPGKNRAERWGNAIGQAGLHSLTTDELLRLQNIVIGDQRFVKMGLRHEGGFIGEHERNTGTPIPDHISARWQDVEKLLQGMIDADSKMRTENTIDPVISAAMIAFGFVFIHPFADGNGRIHRYLIHHVLAERGFAPKGVVFPVSAVILERIDEYRRVLESYSRPRLSQVEWRPTSDGNVEVLNETINLYRYFDATRQAEFLSDCVIETIEKILPEEIRYLEKYDKIKAAITDRIDMPDRTIDLLIRFLHQNKGVLSKRAREKEFEALSEKEVIELQELYAEIFEE